MNNKILLLIIIFILLFPVVFASEIARIPPYSGAVADNSHYYSVVFDQEGEASVIGLLNFKNIKQDALDGIRLEIPGNNIRIINIVQKYFSEDGYKQQYASISYLQQTLSDSIILDLKLNYPIQSQDSASVVIYYKSQDYVNEEGSLFRYNFETIKSDFDIDAVQVGINVNEDLYLKEGKTNVDYKYNQAFSILSRSSFGAAENSALQSSLYNIGSGKYTERVISLDPLESFHVKGIYSDSWLAINIWKFIAILVISLLIISALIFAIIKSFRFIKKENSITRVIASGFLSAFLGSLMWLLFFFFEDNFNKWFGYRMEFILIMIGIVLAIASLTAIFGPAIYFATKYKPIYSTWYIVSLLLSLLVLAFIIGFIFYLIYPTRVY